MFRFPPNATGNEAPYAEDDVVLQIFNELASDSTGKYLIALHQGLPGPEVGDVIQEGISSFAKQFPNGGYLSSDGPTSILSFFGTDGGDAPNGVADDPMTKTYLVSGTDWVHTGIFRFAENTVGMGGLLSPPTYKPAVVSIITSATNCGQLALGYLRNIYAVCGTNTVNVYEHDASGAAKPIRVLSGSKTLLDNPVGIYEGK